MDLLEKKQINIRNHTYVVIYVITRENKYGRHLPGGYERINRVDVLVKDLKDKLALRNAKGIVECKGTPGNTTKSFRKAKKPFNN